MARIASFHLIAESPRRAALAMARLGLDRPRLARVDGLHFWRLLGTGRGSDTGPSIGWGRTGVFAVWDDETSLDRFMAGHRLAARWRRAPQNFHVRLRALGGHGAWRGFDPLEGLEPGNADGPVAVITRADVRRRDWSAFGKASREVDTELHNADGLIDVVGIGEAPVGRLATFSLWESAEAVRKYAYEMPRHQRVIRETREGDWYAEELFARFEPYAAVGTWNGRNPLTQ